METTDVIKGFSCLKMKEEIQATNYEITKNMTLEERDAYYKSKLENGSLWKEFTQKPKSNTPLPKRVALRKKKELA